MRVSWTERRSNAIILETIGGRRDLLATVRKRQMIFLVHVIRVDGLENLAITGRVAASRGRRKPRLKYLDRMKEYIGGEVTAKQLLVITRNLEQWRSISGSVCNGMPHRESKVTYKIDKIDSKYLMKEKFNNVFTMYFYLT